MKEYRIELLLFERGRQVAIQNITEWTPEEIQQLLLVQKGLGRTWVQAVNTVENN